MIDISVTGLIKSFDLEKKILDGITFQIDTGERVGLLGKNGAGKTTLFRILTGELDYDAGEVSIASGRRLGLISQIPGVSRGLHGRGCAQERVFAHAEDGGRDERPLPADGKRATRAKRRCAATASFRPSSRVSAATTPRRPSTRLPTAFPSRRRCASACLTRSRAAKRRA